MWRLLHILMLVETVTGLFSRSTPRMGHCPPFDFWSSWCRSANILLRRLVLSLAVYRPPPSICLSVSRVGILCV